MSKIVTIELPPTTPREAAALEIMELSSRRDLQHDLMVGGPTPPDMVAENKRRDAKRWQLKLEIIAKHGVADEYLAPLYKEERLLSEKLEKVRKEIADLKGIKK